MTDHKTIRLVITLVGAIALVGAVSIAVLAYQGKDIPEALLAVGTTALGALTSMLVSTRGASDADATGTASVSVDAQVPLDAGDGGHSEIELVMLAATLIGVLLLLFGVTLR